MNRIVRLAFAAVLLAFAIWGIATAEITLPVNDNNTGVYDQPSVVVSGNTVYVAFIGDDTTSGTFRVFFAAVNGAANFGNLSLTRDNTVVLIPPFVIDNAVVGSEYFDARHPKIAMRSGTETVILFQAKQTAADVVYRPYIARLGIANNTATLTSLRRITEFPAGVLTDGDIEDISYNLVLTDNTVRMAFANRPTIGSTSPFQVYFARVALDNAEVVGTPIRVDNTVLTGSDGSRPIPSLRVDGLARSHIAWVADNNTSPTAAVYYALVKETSGVDNVAIGATFISGGPKRWSHPSVLVSGNSSVTVVAGHETLAADGSVAPFAGSILLARFNPDAVVQNGLPAQYATESTFYSIRPTTLDDNFVLFRPDAFLDSNGNIHLSGYGDTQSTCIYYAIIVSGASPFASFVTPRTSVGSSGVMEFPGTIPGDYTKAAFGVFVGKTVVFWSGLISGSPNRNLNVTSTPNNIITPAEEKGCSMVKHPRVGESGRIPGTVLLLLPAFVLAVRRLSRGIKRGRGRSVAA